MIESLLTCEQGLTLTPTKERCNLLFSTPPTAPRTAGHQGLCTNDVPLGSLPCRTHSQRARGQTPTAGHRGCGVLSTYPRGPYPAGRIPSELGANTNHHYLGETIVSNVQKRYESLMTLLSTTNQQLHHLGETAVSNVQYFSNQLHYNLTGCM